MALNSQSKTALAQQTVRLTNAVSRFSDAMASLNKGRNAELAYQARTFQRVVSLLAVGAPENGEQQVYDRLKASIDRLLPALETNVARFDTISLLRPYVRPFDEVSLGERLDEFNLDDSEDLDKLVDRVLSDDDDELDYAEQLLNGLTIDGNLALAGRAPKIKALILLIIKLFLKIKYPNTPKEVERLLRMIARQLDKVGAGELATPEGTETPTPGPGGDPPGSPATSNTYPDLGSYRSVLQTRPVRKPYRRTTR